MTRPLLEVEGLTKHFPVTRGVLGRVVGQVRAVDDVSFQIGRGETLGLVGESGCGKTTVGRSVLRLIEPTSGRVQFDGADVTSAGPDELRRLRRSMQIVFQDPYGSLNPRHRVIDIVGEALEQHGILHGPAVERRVAELLRRVGLSPNWINRYPHEFSGGQRQRIGIARAIALEPKLVVCDEPVSALDVSIQAQVINLLKQLGRELELSYLFIAHDLSVVRHISHRIAVMYLGEVAELASAKELFAKPAHPYTRALLSAIPIPDPTRRKRRLVLAGDIPSPLNPPSGCRFHTRCPAVFDRCPAEAPKLVAVEPGHAVRCFHAYDLPSEDWFAELDRRIERRQSENTNQQTHETPWLEPLPEPEAPERAPRVAIASDATAETAERASADRRGKRRWAIAAAAAVLALLLVLVARNIARRTEAQRQLRELTVAVEARRAITGEYPSELEDLGWRLPPIFVGGPPLDPWGRPWVYSAPPPAGLPMSGEPPVAPLRPSRGIQLRSLGPDGVESDDDVSLR